MKKSIVLIVIICTLFACSKKNENQPVTDISTEIESINKKDPLLKIDKEGITDYIIENTVELDCEKLFLSILNSSKQYKKDTKNLDQSIKQNGGIGLDIKLEKQEDAIKYIVSESYRDKNTVINIYFFNTKNKKLYVEDFIINGMLEEIDFDQNLLDKNALNCIK